MRNGAWLGLVLWAAAAAVGCSGDDDGGGDHGAGASGGRTDAGPRDPECIDGDSRCGMTCSSAEPCPIGLFCGDGDRCRKACVYGAPASTNPCPINTRCTIDGQCSHLDVGNPTPFDAGEWEDGSITGPGSMTCADTTVRAERVIPTVILIIDQSGSMTEDFGGDTRWNALRDFLLEPGGLIDDLQGQVNFGFAMYSAMSMPDPAMPDDGIPAGECPLVTTIAPALDNYDAIEMAYSAAEPLDDTPTGDSIEKIIADLDIASDPDAMKTPIVFVLATDGEPDRCELLDPQSDEGKAEAIAAVEHAFMLGIRTFVISVGNEVGADHQQAIANAGLGKMPGDPDAEYWVAGDDASLRDALTSIVGSQLSCDIELQGKVEGGDPCDGHVVLNGKELECNDADGWELRDPQHIELLGAACEELKASDDVLLDVKFPCNVTIVI